MTFPTTLTSSMLDDAKCARLFYQRYIERVVPDVDSIHLVAGAAFADGLAAARRAFYVQGLDAEASMLAGCRALLMGWESDSDQALPKRGTKSITSLLEALSAYFTRWPLAEDLMVPADLGNGPCIEFSFAEPIDLAHPDTGEPLLYSGRCDAICQWGTDLFLMDEKTTSYLGDQWASQWRLRGQFIGYKWGAMRSGHRPAGTFVRGIGLYLSGPQCVETSVYTPDYMVADWYASVLERVSHLINCYKTNQWPKDFGSACTSYGGCSYVDRCASRTPDLIPGFKRVEKLYYER